jgi:alkyl hydroperoxide reductase subunit AhpC
MLPGFIVFLPDTYRTFLCPSECTACQGNYAHFTWENNENVQVSANPVQPAFYGLKIRWIERSVRVRVPPSAPLILYEDGSQTRFGSRF